MRSFLISFITFIPYLKGIFAPFKGFLYKRLFLISFSTTTLLQRDYCPIQGSFCNRPFLSFFFSTSTLIQRDYCPSQGSFSYLYPHSKGLWPHSMVFLQQAIFIIFFLPLPSFEGIIAPFKDLWHTSTLIQRDYCLIQGSFRNRPFLTFSFTSTLIRRDYCPIQWSFFTSTLIQRVIAPFKGLWQQAIPSLFFLPLPSFEGIIAPFKSL